MNASSEYLAFCCGIREVGDFHYGVFDSLQDAIVDRDEDDTGLFISTFMNNKVCKEAYEYLCKHCTLIYQSDLYVNKVHNFEGNEVFLCLFKVKT